jgi:hypothetical protein
MNSHQVLASREAAHKEAGLVITRFVANGESRPLEIPDNGRPILPTPAGLCVLAHSVECAERCSRRGDRDAYAIRW